MTDKELIVELERVATMYAQRADNLYARNMIPTADMLANASGKLRKAARAVQAFGRLCEDVE